MHGFLPHGFYLMYHRFDFLLLDFPIYHLLMLIVALLVLIKEYRNGWRLKRIENALGINNSKTNQSSSRK
jgi:hypothetical protein